MTARGAKYNFQSDWKFLLACIRYDNGTPSTNGKNLIRWMSEDVGIEIDPHSHHITGIGPFTYRYADVAKLIDSLGVPTSLNVGGFTALDTTWHLFEAGIYGNKFPAYFWRPNALWGAGSPGHVADVPTFGVWRPSSGASLADFLTDDPGRRLTLLGNGCGAAIAETTTVQDATAEIVALVDTIRSNAAYQNRMYSGSLHFNVRDLSPALIHRIGEIVGALQAYVDSGEVVWMNLTDKHQTWINDYGSLPTILTCDGDLLGVTERLARLRATTAALRIRPNPTTGPALVEFALARDFADGVRLTLHDVTGRRVLVLHEGPLGAGRHAFRLDAGNLPSGIYPCMLETRVGKRIGILVRLR